MYWNNDWNDFNKKCEAIRSISPSLKFHTINESLDITWSPENTEPIPTEAEIQAEVDRLQTEYDSQEYARKRKAEYPSIEECVHAILDDELDSLQIKRKAIKDKFPKE
tara:strand:- start:36 stop:359 length:324 start_codon:yes stop_codon:yes gene_type:complete